MGIKVDKLYIDRVFKSEIREVTTRDETRYKKFFYNFGVDKLVENPSNRKIICEFWDYHQTRRNEIKEGMVLINAECTINIKKGNDKENFILVLHKYTDYVDKKIIENLPNGVNASDFNKKDIPNGYVADRIEKPNTNIMDAKNLDEIYEENTRTYYMKKKSTEQVNDETEMDINDDLEQQFKELDEYEKK